VDFAPRTPVEVELWKVLVREHGHVSYERVASGSTISALYTFFVRDQRVPESKASAAIRRGRHGQERRVVAPRRERQERGSHARRRALVERVTAPRQGT